ncbi:LuxR family transcriptional regulator [Motiliproteus coralliicola]|uniref:LuxR family transcriptional regulator n=1 Tax=Motiliproteus coralliicola TaxID=2283196 RepID=A0A369WBR8_9GAMM|nr:helix-turn-helix transcriptional regulator [Motiliproteus coralliicola]RDE19458.1 LuxR family transcriptional regulator [Motiliproteus coralliicola]
MSSDTMLGLIDAIYSSASDPLSWPDTANRIQQAIGGHSVNFALENTREPQLTYLYTNGVSQEDTRFYLREIAYKDEVTAVYNHLSVGSAVMCQSVFDERTLHSMYCYQEFYQRVDFENFNAGLFYRDDDRRGWISVVRGLSDKPFSPEAYQLMVDLLPHLKRAFAINLRLLEASKASRIGIDALEHLSAGVVLLSDRGEVITHNSRANPFLYPRNCKSQSYKVQLPDVRATNRLHKLIRATLSDHNLDSDGVVNFVDKGIKKSVLCFPWHSTDQQLDWLGNFAGCILFIISPSDASLPDQQLRHLFDLTKSEVKVLQGILDGVPVKALSDDLFVTEATVRFHLRNLLKKTESRNQAEMISKVMRLVSTFVS